VAAVHVQRAARHLIRGVWPPKSAASKLIAGLALCGAMVACASAPAVERPPDWPKDRVLSDCTELSGRYLNRASATTPWPSRRYEAPEPLLSGVFSDEPDPNDGSQIVWLDIRSDSTIWLGSSENTRPIIIFPPNATTQSRCEHGSLRWRRENDAYSEHSKERQQTDLEFHKAEDGSLIIHRIFRARGLSFLIPFSATAEVWLRFQQAR
jgi:hypothetical protein